ncbi:hypothetical protein [Endozoicomonas sp. ALD040]|uniref:hypothetical protein n=1 Tax=unclassified Endozoicomonas TaxID=2644528 RepID=UPI003BAFCC38
MDGRIVPATNKHALDDNLFHNDFAARLAKQDLSSEANNDAGICTEVIFYGCLNLDRQS